MQTNFLGWNTGKGPGLYYISLAKSWNIDGFKYFQKVFLKWKKCNNSECLGYDLISRNQIF